MRKSEELGRLGWTKRIPLRHRILAVNIFAIAMLAGSILYLDGFRSRLTQARVDQARAEATMIAHGLAEAPASAHQRLLVLMGSDSGTRLRLYLPDGRKTADSWNGSQPTYEMRDPVAEPWPRDLARALDNGFDAIVGARQPPPLNTKQPDMLQAWPEAQRAVAERRPVTKLRRAPEGSPYISAAAPVMNASGDVLLLTVNARDIRRVVRAERLTLGLILGATVVLSILLSLFLARTIATPLRRLSLAAHRVRLGRAREVDVPLLPERRDEIGLLARALHDMTGALRKRIDATESFAADVTHELKNPLASLRSAVDTLERVQDPGLQRQLIDVIRSDVVRLDRMVVEIAEASRLDAELSRARFEAIDLNALAQRLAPVWQARAAGNIRVEVRGDAAATILGDEARLVRMLDNLVDNALSFSPTHGRVLVEVTGGDPVTLIVQDDGPGIPPELREAVFRRFHSVRPDEDFGRHSGLGLAIVKSILDAHDGIITLEDRADGRSGAHFRVTFPADPGTR